MRPRTNSLVSAELGRGIRRRILDAACVVRHFRSCLEHNRRGGNHSLFEGGELSVGHVAEPFPDPFTLPVRLPRTSKAYMVKSDPRSFRRGMLARNISLAHGPGEAMLAKPPADSPPQYRPGMTWPFMSTT